MLKDLLKKTRSYRKFKENERISVEKLRYLVELTRYTPSGRNLQGLKFILSNQAEQNQKIFECLAWAGYLKDWNGPEEGQRPAAYIVAVEDTSLGQITPPDCGLTAMAILLGATEMGYGGCMIVSINKKKLIEVLGIEETYKIQYVLALGVPDEEVVLDDMGENGDYKYWRDENQVHHVPKRLLDDLIL